MPEEPFLVIDMVATGKNIEKLRKSKNLTVKEIQEAFGFSTPQAVYHWQYGVSLPTVDNLVILASIFDVLMDDIIVTVNKGRKRNEKELENSQTE